MCKAAAHDLLHRSTNAPCKGRGRKSCLVRYTQHQTDIQTLSALYDVDRNGDRVADRPTRFAPRTERRRTVTVDRVFLFRFGCRLPNCWHINRAHSLDLVAGVLICKCVCYQSVPLSCERFKAFQGGEADFKHSFTAETHPARTTEAVRGHCRSKLRIETKYFN